MSYPKITIITVVFNNESTIADTLRSVAAQEYPNLEYLVIDGNSTDGTLARVEEHRAVVSRLVSETDEGIYDAMNKGIALASGEIIGFINADDFYTDDVLPSVAAIFEDPDVDACYGDLCYVRQDNTKSVVRYWRSSDFRPGAFETGWCPPHPTFFVRRKVYDELGSFDLRFRIAADFELMLRFLEVHRVRAKYVPRVLVTMRLGGTTNRSIGNIVKQNREILRALRQHGLKPHLVRLIGSKLVSRALQFFLRPPNERVRREPG